MLVLVKQLPFTKLVILEGALCAVQGRSSPRGPLPPAVGLGSVLLGESECHKRRDLVDPVQRELGVGFASVPPGVARRGENLVD